MEKHNARPVDLPQQCSDSRSFHPPIGGRVDVGANMWQLIGETADGYINRPTPAV